jgi:CheY-like chemotaxis protein
MDEPNAGQPGAARQPETEPTNLAEQAQRADQTLETTLAGLSDPATLQNDRPRGPGADPSLAPNAQGDPELERGTVLVAENEENNRLLMEQILGLAGFQCVSATNGLEVLEVLDHLRVDVVLLDLSMPVMDGYRTAQMIRQRPDGARLPVVAVTGYALDEDRAQALDVGCTDYLAKPFRPQDLLAVVERVLGLRGEGA